jgi:protein-disulfide isomerase
MLPRCALRYRLSIFFLLFFLLGASPPSTFAQNSEDTDALKREIESLREGQIQIQKELEGIRKLLAPAERPVPASINLSSDDMPFRGDKTSEVVLVEYFDYQCPFCAGFFNDTMPLVLSDYISKGKLRYLARDFPLEAAHPRALQSAEAAHCANEQGNFWRMHDELMGNSDALERPKLSLYAHDVGLDVASFDKCVDSGKYASRIKEGMDAGAKLGVEGTPTFFLGIMDPSGQEIESVERFDGAVPYSQLKEAIDKLLAREKPSAKARATP